MRNPPWNDDRPAANGQAVKSNFQAWFGNSKITTPDGLPRVLFHGTNQPLENLDAQHLGASTSSVSSRLGFWLTDSPLVAGEYADMAARHLVTGMVAHEKKTEQLMASMAKAEKAGNWDFVDQLTQEMEAHEIGAMREEPTGQNILPVFVRIENPFVIDIASQTQSTGFAAGVIEEALSKGHDGVVFKNSADTHSQTVSDHYVVFDAGQVKSAVGNSGLYLPGSHSLDDLAAHQALGLAREAASEISAKGVKDTHATSKQEFRL